MATLFPRSFVRGLSPGIWTLVQKFYSELMSGRLLSHTGPLSVTFMTKHLFPDTEQ